MRWTTRLAILFLLGYISLAQPGLPACWLMKHPCEVHPHYTQFQASQPHSHDYLTELSLGQVTVVVPIVFTPAGMLFSILFLVNIWVVLVDLDSMGIEWQRLPDSPPPRFSRPSFNLSR